MASIRHIGFVMTLSLRLRTILYVPNIVLNFQVHWFSTSDILGLSCFSVFDLKLPILGKILKFWG